MTSLTLVSGAGDVVQCTEPGHPISPLIYGIAYNPRREGRDEHIWSLGASARRWGGNPSSRYNWRRGDAWNTGADWYFLNVDYERGRGAHWETFLNTNRRRDVRSALTVPILGWVAKDTRSAGFPISLVGPQRGVAPMHPDAGDGLLLDGRKVTTVDASRTSIPSTPGDIGAWMRRVAEMERAAGGPLVDLYILDNEPMLWHVTHRDVRSEPLGYDELLRRTIEFGRVIRAERPAALIAGPAEWGWPAYFYSAVDAEAGFWLKPDRRRHGDTPLIQWYLERLREHEQRTGERILDVLDVHYYPQADGVVNNQRTDPEAAARRVAATRSLWDPTYLDGSWIDEPVALLPRFAKLIDESYPGRRLMLGEYNFGGEGHISGGIALAEALGRFGTHPAMLAAFYWTYPPAGSPAYEAFRVYRNFDGRGGRFLDVSVPVRGATSGVSSFASRDPDRTRLVAISINLDAKQAAPVHLRLVGCGAPTGLRAYRYAAGQAAIQPHTGAELRDGAVTDELPPYSITIYELRTNPETH